MTRSGLTSVQRKVKARLLSGWSVPAISKELKKSTSSVYDIVNQLLALGEIRHVPGTKSPKLYEDPQNDVTIPPKGESDDGIRNFGPAVQSDGSPRTADVVPDSPLIDLTGVSTAKVCPEGYGEAHITGSINYTIRKVGTYDDIRDRRGFVVGYWRSEPKTKMKGAIVYGGEVRIFNQALGIAHRIGNKGGQLFSLYPKRIYVDPIKFRGTEDVMALFTDRALYVAEVLRQTGWQLTDPVVKGDLHLAWGDHPLIQHFDSRVHLDDGDLIMDTSPGTPELEMENLSSDPDGWAKAQLMATLPSRFLALEGRESEDRRAVSANARILESVGSDVELIVPVLQKIVDAQTAQCEILRTQLRMTTEQVQINANLIQRISAGDQFTLDRFSPSPDGQTANETSEPRRLEGYQ